MVHRNGLVDSLNDLCLFVKVLFPRFTEKKTAPAPL